MPRDPQQHANKIASEKGLPANIDAERFVLGSILLDHAIFTEVVGSLQADQFILESHQRIYRRMVELHERSEKVDRITLANELLRFSELESVGGLSYLVSLDDGLPKIRNLDGYIRIIRDKADLRSLVAIGQGLMNAALIGQESPDKIAQAADSRINQIVSGMVATKRSWTFEETVEQTGMSDFLAPKMEGIPSGFDRLDRITYGFEPGLLYIIGGDSGHGKSSLASNMAKNVALGTASDEWKVDPQPVAIFSLEMTKEAIYRRILCGHAKVSSFRLKKGFCEREERSRLQFASADLVNAPLYIDDSSGLGIHEFCNRVKKMRQQYGIKVAFLDYLQLMDWREDGLKSEYEGVTYATWSIKQLAKEEKMSIVVLTQFNQAYSTRKDKGSRPTMDSCHASGSIKKDADIGILIFKRSQAHPGLTDEKNRSELIVAKHRDGPTGVVVADWYGSWTTFVEAPEEVQPQRDDKE